MKLNGESEETGLYVGHIQDYGSHQLVEIFSRESGECLLVYVDVTQELRPNQYVTVQLDKVKTPVLFESGE